MNAEIFAALRQLEKERGIPVDYMVEKITQALVAAYKKDRDGYFAPGRFVMTCCVEDIAFMGLPCKYADAASLHAREWVMVEATVSVRFHALYRGTCPILTAIRVTPAEPAKNEVATF